MHASHVPLAHDKVVGPTLLCEQAETAFVSRLPGTTGPLSSLNTLSLRWFTPATEGAHESSFSSLLALALLAPTPIDRVLVQ